MHKYTQQEAALAVVVDPYDENPVRYDPDDKDHIIGNVERSKRANTCPEIRKEMPDSPNKSDYETRGKSAITSLKLRDRESSPAKFLKKARHKTNDDTESHKSGNVPRSDYGR